MWERRHYNKCNFEKHNLHTHGRHAPLDCQPCKEFFAKHVDIAGDKLVKLSELTKAQPRELWFDSRKIRITASSATKCPKKQKTSPAAFVNWHLYPFQGNTNTKHGVSNEPVARTCFERKSGKCVRLSGTIVCRTDKWLSASPDGIVEGHSILDVKCPMTSDLDAPIKSSTYDVKEDTNGTLYLCPKGRNGYSLHCQLLMHCARLSHTSFYVWTLTQDALANVQYDKLFTLESLEWLRKFYFENLLPTIVNEVASEKLHLSKGYLSLCG